jgi:hypothetical protein
MKTAYRRCRLFPFALILSLLAGGLTGCSDDSTGVDKALAPLVGTWRAAALVLTNAANPEVSLDLVEAGATFTLSVLGNGQYSASLAAFGQSNTEIGRIEVSGNQVTITPTTPTGPSIVGTFEFQGSVLVVDGGTEYDFNQDGISESALVHMELDPLES